MIIYNNCEDVLMKDVDLIFGINAGKIWQALNPNSTLTKNQIIGKTKLNNEQFYQSIGWLARENKIKREGEFYQLDNTNLSEKIELNANKIFDIFKDGLFNIEKLSNLIEMNFEDYNIALGWLAREGKINNDILNNKLPIFSNNNEFNELKNEILYLNRDIETRDEIIKQLSDQLILNQYNKIEDLDENNKLKNNLKLINEKLKNKNNELKTKKIQIEDLRMELDNLNSDIETRNIIINQITEQLTDKQNKIIENFGMIKNLENKLYKKSDLVNLTNEKIKKINNIQDNINNDLSNSENIDSTLFEKPNSLLKKQDNIIDGEEDINHSIIKKKDIKLDDI